jgi:hypothetical protein
MSSDQYCVYFDHRYAVRGLTMIGSLRARGGAGPVWVLCLSQEAEAIVAAFDMGDIRIVPLERLERHFPGLADARSDRSTIEYYFTLTPFIVRYVFDMAPEAKRVAYLDSDLYFFGPVAEIWACMGDAPVAIIPHNWHRRGDSLARFGLYNVSWTSFSRSPQGLRCLQYWQASCREWCRDVCEPGRFADQGYLDRFHEHAPDLAIVTHKGCDLAPWNIGQFDIRFRDGRLWVDEQPLLFFHFTAFKKDIGGRWYNGHWLYRAGTSATVRDRIYRPYLQALVSARARVAPLLPKAGDETAPLKRKEGGGGFKARAYRIAERAARILDLVTGKAIKEPRADQAPASASNSARSRT